jgi:hypothetical protein
VFIEVVAVSLFELEEAFELIGKLFLVFLSFALIVLLKNYFKPKNLKYYLLKIDIRNYYLLFLSLGLHEFCNRILKMWE